MSAKSVETLDHPREQVLFGVTATVFLLTFGVPALLPAGAFAGVVRVLMVAAIVSGLAVMLRAVTSVPAYGLAWFSTAAAVVALTAVVHSRRT